MKNLYKYSALNIITGELISCNCKKVLLENIRICNSHTMDREYKRSWKFDNNYGNKLFKN